MSVRSTHRLRGPKARIERHHGLRQEGGGESQPANAPRPYRSGFASAEPINLDDAPSHPTLPVRYRTRVKFPIMAFKGVSDHSEPQGARRAGGAPAQATKVRGSRGNLCSPWLLSWPAPLPTPSGAGELERCAAGSDTVHMRYLEGRPSAPVAAGKVVVAYRLDDLDDNFDRRSEDPELEIAQFRDAVCAGGG